MAIVLLLYWLQWKMKSLENVALSEGTGKGERGGMLALD